MHLLTLNANPEGWRIFTARKDDPVFQNFSRKVWQRDHYTCQFCGFQARDFQEVVNLDQDYHHNKISNLVTACCFCAQCGFLESVGMGNYGGGTLIYFPELTQNQLNSFCHVIFCAIANETAYKETAQSFYRGLKLRAQFVENQFGEGTSAPNVMGQLLMEAQAKSEISMGAILKEVRLLPSRAAFKIQIEKWAQTALNELSGG